MHLDVHDLAASTVNLFYVVGSPTGYYEWTACDVSSMDLDLPPGTSYVGITVYSEPAGCGSLIRTTVPPVGGTITGTFTG